MTALTHVDAARPAASDDVSGSRARLQELIERYGIHRKGSQRLISNTGAPLNWLIDMRAVFLQPEAMTLIARSFWDLYGDRGRVQIAGMEVAAVPLVASLVLEGFNLGHDASGLVIRKERKATGLGRSLEGTLGEAPIILVDDVVNSGTSLEKSRASLEGQGRRPDEVFVIIDYESPRSLAWRREHGLVVRSLFKLRDFDLKLARKQPAPDTAYEKVWSFAPGTGNPFHVVPKSQPVVHDDLIIYGTCSGSVIAVDARTGGERWRFQTRNSGRKGVWSSPALHLGQVYFGAYNGRAYALDARTGTETWSNPACEWIGSSPTIVPRHGIVVFGLEHAMASGKGGVAAFDLASGEARWEIRLPEYQHGSAVYWEEGDLLVSGTNDGRLVAQSAETGDIAWSFGQSGPIKYRPALDLACGTVVSASHDGSIRVNSLRTGELVGECRTNELCYTTPLVVGDRIYCGSGDRNLYVLDAPTCRVVQKLECGSKVFSSPVVHDGRLIAGCHGGVVREWDLASLRLRGLFAVPDAVTNAVVCIDDLIVVPTYTNELHAFRRSSAPTRAAGP